MNSTLRKFGFPHNQLWRNDHWIVLLRPQQVTLASLVMCTASEAKSFSELSAQAGSDHARVLQLVERALMAFRTYDRINFLTLMMVDPHLHTHIFPRYAKNIEYDGSNFKDSGWPATPDLKSANEITDQVREKLLKDLTSAFRSADA
jgi:diadenosine tetraphosphate (Ap4A) HIT family hydrolase